MLESSGVKVPTRSGENADAIGADLLAPWPPLLKSSLSVCELSLQFPRISTRSRQAPSSKSIRLRRHYCTRNTIFPSRCPASRRLCACAALASGYSAAIGTCSFAASTALFRRSNSPLPETKL